MWVNVVLAVIWFALAALVAANEGGTMTVLVLVLFGLTAVLVSAAYTLAEDVLAALAKRDAEASQ